MAARLHVTVASKMSVIAKRTRVGGPIETEGDLVVDGRVEGAIRAAGCVTVGPSGVVISDLVVGRAVVIGIVIGSITASERVDVAAGGRVVGDVRAPTVTIVATGAVEGRVEQQGLPPPHTRPTLRIRPSRPEAGIARPPTDPLDAGPPEPPRPAGRARMLPRRNSGDR
jgi:cytoskeletal protein CcmA (bactofilin family)